MARTWEKINLHFLSQCVQRTWRHSSREHQSSQVPYIVRFNPLQIFRTYVCNVSFNIITVRTASLRITEVVSGCFWGLLWLRRSVTGFSPRKPGFDPCPVHVCAVPVLLFPLSVPSTAAQHLSSCYYYQKGNLYVGESKTIRTIGTCFAVGSTAGWSWQNTHGLLLSYHCGAGVTLIFNFCHEFLCHKHGHSQFHLHQRRAEGSDPFLWAEGVLGVEMHRMMSVQYGNSVMSQRIVC